MENKNKENKKIKVNLKVGIHDFENLFVKNEIEEQSLREAAKFIDEKIVEFQKKGADYNKALIVSCLVLVQEIFQKKNQRDADLDMMGNIISDMQQKIKIYL